MRAKTSKDTTKFVLFGQLLGIVPVLMCVFFNFSFASS